MSSFFTISEKQTQTEKKPSNLLSNKVNKENLFLKQRQQRKTKTTKKNYAHGNVQARLNNKGCGSEMLKQAWHFSHLAPCLTLLSLNRIFVIFV